MTRWLLAFALSSTLLFGNGAARAAPVDAAVTIGMIGDVVGNVGGACVAVTAIMGPGVDPHLYKPSARDVQTFQRAEIILYSGYSLEGQLGDVLGRFSRMKPTVAVAPLSIAASDLIAAEGGGGAVDPHLWMDAGLWARIVPTVADAMAKLRPDCADRMRVEAERYGTQLAALHDWVRASIATIPKEQRILVTAHDAFAYYGRAYGIEVAGIQGISTESEAGIADIRKMAAIIGERKVPAVFVESTINPRTIQAVIDAARDKGHEVRIGGQLHSDAMGEAGSAAGTYIGMIHANTATIVTALGGTLPDLPDALRDWAATWNIRKADAGPTPAR